MKKSQLNALKKMLDDPDVRGKKHLKALIWMNETEPKYKKGDCFEYTDRSHRVYGVPVVKFHARAEKVRWYTGFGEFYLQYELVGHVKCGSKENDITFYARESELKVKVKDNLTVIAGDENDSVEAIDVPLPL